MFQLGGNNYRAPLQAQLYFCNEVGYGTDRFCGLFMMTQVLSKREENKDQAIVLLSFYSLGFFPFFSSPFIGSALNMARIFLFRSGFLASILML